MYDQNARGVTPDPDCPEGYRFLVQLPEVVTKDEAEKVVRRMFPDKKHKAIFRFGTMLPIGGDNSPWHRVEHGWSAFVRDSH